MFQSSSNRLRAWLKAVSDALDDVLGDPPAAEPPHPHRRPVRIEHRRRPGAVRPRPAHCVSPVRPGGGRVETEQVP